MTGAWGVGSPAAVRRNGPLTAPPDCRPIHRRRGYCRRQPASGTASSAAQRRPLVKLTNSTSNSSRLRYSGLSPIDLPSHPPVPAPVAAHEHRRLCWVVVQACRPPTYRRRAETAAIPVIRGAAQVKTPSKTVRETPKGHFYPKKPFLIIAIIRKEAISFLKETCGI